MAVRQKIWTSLKAGLEQIQTFISMTNLYKKFLIKQHIQPLNRLINLCPLVRLKSARDHHFSPIRYLRSFLLRIRQQHCQYADDGKVGRDLVHVFDAFCIGQHAEDACADTGDAKGKAEEQARYHAGAAGH